MKPLTYSIRFLSLIILLISGCNIKTEEHRLGLLKNEILKVEKSFAELAITDGVENAFLTYAADDAILNRNNTLLKGKDAIGAYFKNETLKDVKLEWAPDFVDVSLTGDMAYTYGRYKLSAIDTEGKEVLSEGNFHTVWKRQKDGSWKYVWD